MYRQVVLGGTFDHLHAGHQDLLSLACSLGVRVCVGLTKASMNHSKSFADQIQSYQMRKAAISSYVHTRFPQRQLKIFPITDPYGTTLTDDSLEAIIVTDHTAPIAQNINLLRTQRGLPTLVIHVCRLRTDAHGEVLCSSNIRAGIVDRVGRRYIDLLQHTWHVSEETRSILRRPFGKTFYIRRQHRTHSQILVVGDVVTQMMLRHHQRFHAAYIDGHSKKLPFDLIPTTLKEMTHLQNPAGTLQPQMVSHLTAILSTTSPEKIYQIEGEEDLLAVALVILAPLGSKVIYGYPYPPTGPRIITVTERIKRRFASLFHL